MSSYLSEIVNKDDNKKAIIASILAMIVAAFILFFVKYHEPDPPKLDIPLVTEMIFPEGIDAFEIDNGGGGAPVNETTTTATKEPTREEATQDDSPVDVPSSIGEKQTNNTNTSSKQSSEQSSPFSGTGGNSDKGGGTGFGGAEEGGGTSTGPPGDGGSEKARIRLTNITSTPKTPNSEHSKIALILTVNYAGNVLTAKVDRNETTSENEALIEEIIKLAKKEVKYKAKPVGTPVERCFYSAVVKPN